MFNIPILAFYYQKYIMRNILSTWTYPISSLEIYFHFKRDHNEFIFLSKKLKFYFTNYWHINTCSPNVDLEFLKISIFMFRCSLVYKHMFFIPVSKDFHIFAFLQAQNRSSKLNLKTRTSKDPKEQRFEKAGMMTFLFLQK